MRSFHPMNDNGRGNDIFGVLRDVFDRKTPWWPSAEKYTPPAIEIDTNNGLESFERNFNEALRDFYAGDINPARFIRVSNEIAQAFDLIILLVPNEYYIPILNDMIKKTKEFEDAGFIKNKNAAAFESNRRFQTLTGKCLIGLIETLKNPEFCQEQFPPHITRSVLNTLLQIKPTSSAFTRNLDLFEQLHGLTANSPRPKHLQKYDFKESIAILDDLIPQIKKAMNTPVARIMADALKGGKP